MSRLVAAESPIQLGAAAPEAVSECALSEEQLWSWVDRDADELSTHVEGCSRCRALVHEIRSGMNAVRISSEAPCAVMPEKIGPYKVIRLLGQGGQGLVYEAVQPDPHRRVALKVVRGGRFVDPQNVRLFEREVQTLARMKHPAIGAIYEAGITPEGLRYFAMELIEGHALVAQDDVHRLALEHGQRLLAAAGTTHLEGLVERAPQRLLRADLVVDDEDGGQRPAHATPRVFNRSCARHIVRRCTARCSGVQACGTRWTKW